MKKDRNIVTFEEFKEANRDTLRSEFTEYLVSERGYARYVAEESEDGMEERIYEYYKNS